MFKKYRMSSLSDKYSAERAENKEAVKPAKVKVEKPKKIIKRRKK